MLPFFYELTWGKLKKHVYSSSILALNAQRKKVSEVCTDKESKQCKVVLQNMITHYSCLSTKQPTANHAGSLHQGDKQLQWSTYQ